MTAPQPLHLAVALDNVGWHPAAGAGPDAPDGNLFSLAHWTALAQEAERGLLDFVTVEDPPKRPAGHVNHRLDAVLVASALAATTERIGLIPSIVTDHAQPTNVAKAIATLDHLSDGRAGWRTPVTPARPIVIADIFTPEVQTPMAALFERAADLVRVVRALWDGVDDEKALRDTAAPGRFAPADPDPHGSFTEIEPLGGAAGDWITIDSPSLAPRAPQGHPVVFTVAHITLPYRYGARSADVVSVTPHSVEEARATVEEVRAEQAAAGRADQKVHVFGELVVFLDSAPGRAAERLARLDEAHGSTYASDAEIVAGTPAEVADLLLQWQEAGLSGFRLRPGALPHDLNAITRELVPELQARGAFRTSYEADTLRGLLGLPVPPAPAAP
ncbi:LLM class flavin-dependent oxidoreductase [Streptomyces sp. NPDC005576]|uniref:LLM class flavin-dependent oxidoreductase n=1 Tax=Streptomyces sp. NPDC005576 TaxID=3364726 RepID=UPI00369F4A10